MRCLYCGKELALFKRFTSGGEFCSDAHRQQYQDEYNQLALNRLLQAKPQPEAKPAETKPVVEAKSVETKVAEKKAPEPAPAPVKIAPPPPAPAPVIAAIAAPPDEEPAPAEPSGFLLELPVPVMAEVMSMSSPALELEHSSAPAIPSRDFENWEGELVAAGRVVMQPALSISDSIGRADDRRVEVREFVRGAAVVDFDLPPSSEIGLPEVVHEPMEIPTVRYPPQEAVALWEAPAQDFAAYDTDLGDLARVLFEPDGIEQNASRPSRSMLMGSENTAAIAPDPIPAPPVAPAAQNAPDSFQPVFSNPAPPAVEKKPDPVPEIVTRTMTVTLHGVAAGKGKPLPVFTAGVPASVDVQIPRSNALPLRVVMTLETAVPPAPPEVKVEAKVEEKRPERTIVVRQDSRKGRQDPRFANGKVRKPELPEPEPEVKQPELKEVEVKVPEIAAAAVETKVEPKIEAKPERPYTQPDLGLPSLSMEQSNGFLSKLPLAGKLALAAVVLLIIGFVIFSTMKSSSADAASIAPRVVEAPALATADSGWITDWGTEPGVRRTHDISVLKPSVSLTDYRMEFQGQIENKALGWVYRAQDGKNYYVSKLEIVKPGVNPAVALVRFAVINGEEQPRSQFPLAINAHLDTVYNIRFDAVGDHFTTWVQDQKIDDFTDERIKTGGVGLYSDHGEKTGLKGPVRVVPLMIKK